MQWRWGQLQKQYHGAEKRSWVLCSGGSCHTLEQGQFIRWCSLGLKTKLQRWCDSGATLNCYRGIFSNFKVRITYELFKVWRKTRHKHFYVFFLERLERDLTWDKYITDSSKSIRTALKLMVINVKQGQYHCAHSVTQRQAWKTMLIKSYLLYFLN